MLTNFRKKQKGDYSKKLVLTAGGILIVIFSVMLVIANVKMYKKRQVLNTQIQSLENKITDIENRNEELKEGIAKADDETYIEKVAREELDLQKPGEKVFSFVKAPEEIKETETQKKNSLETFAAWIGGWFR